MSTKDTASAYDCYESAELDEPMFVLLARDPVAAILVRHWVILRQMKCPEDEVMQHTEAMQTADAMDDWFLLNRT